MNADAFRQLYQYHISINHEIWDKYITPLTKEQFLETVEYSVGSIRNQVVHMMNVDDAWFSDLSGETPTDFDETAHWTNRNEIRIRWDGVEDKMRAYLDNLTDEMLTTKPLSGEDENLILWQILLHVANHGTDHRAQLLRLLHDAGVNTGPQDYVFYLYDNQ